MKLKVFGVDIFLSYPAVSLFCIALLSDKNGNLIWCLIASLIHEAGHIIIMIVSGVRIRKISVNVGDVAIVADSQNIAVRSELFVSFAGVAFNLILMSVSALLVFFTHIDIFSHVFMSNLCVAFFNLLPVKYLDGGHILTIILQKRFSHKCCDAVLNILTVLFLFPIAIIGLIFLFQSEYNYSLLFAALYLLCTLISKEFKNVS